MKKIYTTNPRWILLCITVICFQVYANNKSFILEKDSRTKTRMINRFFNRSDSLFLPLSEDVIEGFAITGKIVQYDEKSFVRIILEDKEGHEFVVVESNKLYNDVDTLDLSDYCEETKILPYVSPSVLRIYVNNASLEISQIAWNPSELNLRNQVKRMARQKEKAFFYRREQSQYIVNRINENNRIHKRLWRASNTELSIMPWAERKKLGVDDKCPPTGFEYYASGIFEFGEAQNEQIPRDSSVSPYVDSFDWRNRHGINWMTPVKEQQGNTCWAFAAVGVTEALVNLYFNRKIDYNLSEQEVVSCSGCGYTGGGQAGPALAWIAVHGVSEEDAFPFSNSDEPCSNMGEYDELITLNGTSVVSNYTNNTDEVKKALIKYGPMASGTVYYSSNGSNMYTSVGHAMTLVGYATLHGDTIQYMSGSIQEPNYFDVIQSGDNRIGKTYWIFKNSYGTNLYYLHQGYSYVLFNDQDCFRQPYYATTPVSSLLYSDSSIVCEDIDGDGFYNWGIGPKPAHCLSWVPDTPDGDDSDYAKGPMDEYGHLADIPSMIPDSTIYITENTVWNARKYVYHNVYVYGGKTLRITNDINFYRGVTLNLAAGSTLIVDGGSLTDVTINYTGTSATSIQLLNNGAINYLSNHDFVVPLGVSLDFNYGKIE